MAALPANAAAVGEKRSRDPAAASQRRVQPRHFHAGPNPQTGNYRHRHDETASTAAINIVPSALVMTATRNCRIPLPLRQKSCIVTHWNPSSSSAR
jgi:hypothetical protein